MYSKHTRFLFLIALSLMAIFCVAGLSGCGGPTDKNGYQYSWSDGDQGYSFYIGRSFNIETTEVVIPETYRDKPVVKIVRHSFANNYKLNGDGWTTGQTDKITSITIPSSIKKIEGGAFADCSSLSKIVISSENTTYKSVGNCVIESSSNKLIATCGASEIPDDIVNFVRGACMGTYIQNNIEDNSVAYVNNFAVGYKGSPNPQLELEPNTVGIAPDAFLNWHGLESITIPPTVKSIGEFAFGNCHSLTSLFIPISVEIIWSNAFWGSGIKKIYAEAKSKPSNWDGIAGTQFIVEWGCKSNTIDDD